MGGSESKPVPEVTLSPEIANMGFPKTMFLTYMSSMSKLAVNIAAPDSTVVYTLNLPGGWAGHVTLHPGPSVKVPPIVYSAKKHKKINIVLPAVPCYDLPGNHQVLQYEDTMDGERYSFSMVVGQGGAEHVENFVWRRSGGSEVKSLKQASEKLSGHGWKLIRLGDAQYSQEAAPVRHSCGQPAPTQSAPGFGSDGKEIVAIWADPTLFTASTVGAFQFRGSGDSPELGYHWALMALMSALGIWKHQTARAAGQAGDIADAVAA
ncbi:hypothetical protein ACHAPT_001387 [Fusarium lateritium]